MHRKTMTLLLAAIAALVLCAPASANYRVGLSEQNAATFDQPLWQGLKLKRVRYIVPWDFYKGDGTAEVTSFMNAAHAHKQEVLVMFTARRGCYSKRQVLEVERLQGAFEVRLHDRLQEVQGRVPVGEDLRAVERGQPRLPADLEVAQARRRLLRRAEGQLQGLHGPRRRRARPEQRQDVAEELHQVLAQQGPGLGPAQLQGRQPQAVQGPDERARRPFRARSG